MEYPRQLYPALESELRQKTITVLTGMRRVGKTTALNHLFARVSTGNKAMLDLENPLHRKVFEEENYDAVWNNLAAFGITKAQKAYIFLDEVQNLPAVSRVVKYLFDHWDVKFILTGSSSFYLRNLFPESLSGRKLVFELFPLTFSEFLIFRGITRPKTDIFGLRNPRVNTIWYAKLKPLYEEYMVYGGFPSVVLEENQERKRSLLIEIFTSYFEKDAKNLADFRDMSKLRDLILLLAARIGSRLDITKLASELSLSRITVYTYLSFLERTYVIALLSKFTGSIDRQKAGSQKVFFCDSGLAGALGAQSTGQRFEQSVFQSLRIDHKLSYYATENGSEIDFVLDNTLALEVKETASRRDIETLRRRSMAIKLKKWFIVSKNITREPHTILASDL